MRRSLALCLLTGCAYQPGSYRALTGAFAGERTTVGCLDLALARSPVADEAGGVVLRYEFGNRCDQPQLVDFAAVRVVGRTRSGREAVLHPYDPDLEITPLPLDGRSHGVEAIAYRAGRGEAVTSACVDVASLVHAAAPRWLCVGAGPAAVAVQP